MNRFDYDKMRLLRTSVDKYAYDPFQTMSHLFRNKSFIQYFLEFIHGPTQPGCLFQYGMNEVSSHEVQQGAQCVIAGLYICYFGRGLALIRFLFLPEVQSVFPHSSLLILQALFIKHIVRNQDDQTWRTNSIL